jgi:hypothetical protein
MNLLIQLHILLLLMKVKVLILVIQLFSKLSRLALGLTQPPIYWVPGALSTGVKWPPPTANVTHQWTYMSTPLYAFMACTGKHYIFFVTSQCVMLCIPINLLSPPLRFYPEDKSSRVHWNAATYLPDCMVSHPRGP